MVSKQQQDQLPVGEGRSSKMEQSLLQVAAHQRMIESDDDFGEGEVEDTQATNLEGSLAAAQALQMASPVKDQHESLAVKNQRSRQSDTKSSRSRTSRKSQTRGERSSSKQSARHKLPPFQSIYSRQLLESFPQRTRWEIPDSKIVFSSEFCSGNMSRAARGFQKNYFDIWVACDASPHMDGAYYRTWFYFSVTGVPQGELITFTFKNLSNQTKLYNQGLKPAYRVMPTHQKKWRRIMTKASTFFNNDEQFTLQFSHMFAYPESATTYFAFTFPFSYQDSLELTDQIQQKLTGANNCYFNREILYYSLEGRPMELLTISSKDQITEEHETIPADAQGCFPAAVRNPKSRPLCFRKEKPVIFLTSRVHPGETPGSHVLNGFLEMLCDLRSEQGKCLRKSYVFKVIMMLNPDGVSRGYYRLDTMACNLNRMYLNPSKADNPTIWATRKAVVQQAEQYNCLKMFLDFHAHASKRGGFMFGNHITDTEKQADNITFVKLIAMNCLNFDMNECNFSDKIMAIKDRNGQSREGSSRVALSKATGLVYCYTLEFNYHSGRRINTLAPKYARTTGTIEAETEMTDPQSKIYANLASPPFTKEIFEDCGRGVGSALLDLIEDNPISRIPLSCYRTVNNVRTDILNNLSKYESGNVNVVGANHFAPTNTKVAKAFANTPGPRIKLNGSAGHASKIEQEKLKKAASLLTAPKKPAHGTFGVTKRLLDDQTNTTTSTKAHRNADSSLPKEKKNSASVRNPNLNQNGGTKSRQTTTCNSASQQPPASRGTIARLHQTNSAKQKPKVQKQHSQGQYLQQTQLGVDANGLNTVQNAATSEQMMKSEQQQQQQQQQVPGAENLTQYGRLTDQQIAQLHQYHLAMQQQQHQMQQQAAAAQSSLLLNNFGNPIGGPGSQPAFLMSQAQQQKDLQSQRLFMQNQITFMQNKMAMTNQAAVAHANLQPTSQQSSHQQALVMQHQNSQQHQHAAVANAPQTSTGSSSNNNNNSNSSATMHQQQLIHQQLIAQKQAILQQRQLHQQQQAQQQQMKEQQSKKLSPDRQQHHGIRVNQSMAQPISKATIVSQQEAVVHHPHQHHPQQQQLNAPNNHHVFEATADSFSLPNPNGTSSNYSAHHHHQHHHHQQQQQMLPLQPPQYQSGVGVGGKIRSKSHIRSDLCSNGPVEVGGNAAHNIANAAGSINNNYAHATSSKKHHNQLNNSHYSPCPKIPSALIENVGRGGGDQHAMQQLQHYAAGGGGGNNTSLVPLTSSDEKPSAGRWSARQYNPLDKSNNNNHRDARSVAAAEQSQLHILDSYDRRSYDSKGQALHRSAMHVKNTGGMLPPKGGYDPHGLHAQKQNQIMTGNAAGGAQENHYLPNISPNYTSANNQNAGLAHNGQQQNNTSSRTLSSIPQINKQMSSNQSPKLLQQTGSQQLHPSQHHHPGQQNQQVNDFINHRSLKPAKKPAFTTVLSHQSTAVQQHQNSHQLNLMGHKRNQHSKASLQQLNSNSGTAAIRSHETTIVHPALAAAVDRQQYVGAVGNAGGKSSKQPIMQQAALYKSSNTQITSAQAAMMPSFDAESGGIVLNQINLSGNANIMTPKTNVKIRGGQVKTLHDQNAPPIQAFIETQHPTQQIQARPKHHAKPPQNSNKRASHKSTKVVSHNVTHQSAEGSLKLTTAVSVGSTGHGHHNSKKTANRLNSKVQSSHSDKDKRIQ